MRTGQERAGTTKPFDVATKNLIENDPLAWLRLLGLPGEQAEVVDADLATVVAEADRIVRVHNPDYLAHSELQATYKVDIGPRTMLYNVVACYRYGLPVVSVVVLLRKLADGPAVSGVVEYKAPGQSEPSLTFRYTVVRVWELAPDVLLNGPIALLPLAPISSVAESELPSVVRRMEQRINSEAPQEREVLWTTTFLLLGLRLGKEAGQELLKGVMNLRESATYQGILEEGVEVGRVEEAKRILLLAGNKRFGPPDATVQATLDNTTSIETFEQLLLRSYEVESWQELLS